MNGKNHRSVRLRAILRICTDRFRRFLSRRLRVAPVAARHTSRERRHRGRTGAANRPAQAEFGRRAHGHRDNADIDATLNIPASGNNASGVVEAMRQCRPVKRQRFTEPGLAKQSVELDRPFPTGGPAPARLLYSDFRKKYSFF